MQSNYTAHAQPAQKWVGTAMFSLGSTRPIEDM